MRLLLRIFPLFMLSFLLVSCGGSKISEAEKSSAYLFLSQGGGVTGKYEGYILYDDGRVEETDGELQEKPTPKGKIPKREAEKMFESWQNLSKQKEMPFKPGNMNYKIIHGSGDDMLVIDWSDSQNIDPKIQEFFYETFKKLKSAK